MSFLHLFLNVDSQGESNGVNIITVILLAIMKFYQVSCRMVPEYQKIIDFNHEYCLLSCMTRKKQQHYYVTENNATFSYIILSFCVFLVILLLSRCHISHVDFTLPKTPKSCLISQWGNFVERHSFCRVSSKLSETLQKLCLSTTFPPEEIGKTLVFYAVLSKSHGENLEKEHHWLSGVDQPWCMWDSLEWV